MRNDLDDWEPDPDDTEGATRVTVWLCAAIATVGGLLLAFLLSGCGMTHFTDALIRVETGPPPGYVCVPVPTARQTPEG